MEYSLENKSKALEKRLVSIEHDFLRAFENLVQLGYSLQRQGDRKTVLETQSEKIAILHHLREIKKRIEAL